MKKAGYKRLWIMLLLPVSFIIIAASRAFPKVTENIYSLGFYKIWSAIFKGITGWVPFSVSEFMLIAFIVWAVAYTARTVRRVFVKQNQPTEALKQWSATIASIASVLIFIFAVNCAPNYSRLTFSHYSGLSIRQSSVQELAELCIELVSQANGLADKVSRNENGEMQLSKSDYETARSAKQAFEEITKQYPVLAAGSGTLPKPVVFSEMMSYARITGIFSAYTYEANVNIHTNDSTIPSTMCHELSHVAGFMREDEANFISYLACKVSENPDLKYSGTLQALNFASNALFRENRELWQQVMLPLDKRVWQDFYSSNEYWRRYETSFGKFSEKVNDTYLRANNQTDGIKSYGRMIDLLLAEYRQRNGIE